MRLSILVNGVPNRLSAGPPPSLASILAQASAHGDVEVLYLVDNKKRSIGEKRTALLQLARGEYVAAVDDDDDVADDYVERLLGAMATHPDVIVFPVKASFDGIHEGVVEQSIHNPEQEPYLPGGVTRRRPIQIACWRREMVSDIPFPAVNAGEDFGWGDLASARAVTEIRVDAVLYHYRWRQSVSEAIA